MLLSTSRLEEAKLEAEDGSAGKITTFLFDEEHWVLRYIVVRSGFLSLGGSVLISPMSVTGPVHGGDSIRVGLTREQIRNSPTADLAKPISRAKEEQFHRYHEIPVYWGGSGLWGNSMTPKEFGTITDRPESAEVPPELMGEDHHLRSTREVEGYSVHATDVLVGKVVDFVMEDSSWRIRYVHIETPHEIGNGHLYVSPQWVAGISWIEKQLALDVRRDRLVDVPSVGIQGELSREDEARLHEFFGQKPYWE
jgi:hypothetical protein